MMTIPTIYDFHVTTKDEEARFQKEKYKILTELSDDSRAFIVNWAIVIDDIADQGYSKIEISMALGASYTWASSIAIKGIRKIDYPVGMALKQMHKKVCPDIHKERFGV
jgi:hypothetical protein